MELFAPTTIVTTAIRTRDGEEPSTNVVKETTYRMEADDMMLLTFASVMIERGKFHEGIRETVRLESGKDVVPDAIIAFIRHCINEVNTRQCGELYTNRCAAFLDRVIALLPQDAPVVPGTASITTFVEV